MNDQSSSNNPISSLTPSKRPGRPSLGLSREGMLKRQSEQAKARRDTERGSPTHKKRGRKRKYSNDDEQKDARRRQQDTSRLNIAKKKKEAGVIAESTISTAISNQGAALEVASKGSDVALEGVKSINSSATVVTDPLVADGIKKAYLETVGVTLQGSFALANKSIDVASESNKVNNQLKEMAPTLTKRIVNTTSPSGLASTPTSNSPSSATVIQEPTQTFPDGSSLKSASFSAPETTTKNLGPDVEVAVCRPVSALRGEHHVAHDEVDATSGSSTSDHDAESMAAPSPSVNTLDDEGIEFDYDTEGEIEEEPHEEYKTTSNDCEVKFGASVSSQSGMDRPLNASRDQNNYDEVDAEVDVDVYRNTYVPVNSEKSEHACVRSATRIVLDSQMESTLRNGHDIGNGPDHKNTTRVQHKGEGVTLVVDVPSYARLNDGDKDAKVTVVSCWRDDGNFKLPVEPDPKLKLGENADDAKHRYEQECNDLESFKSDLKKTDIYITKVDKKITRVEKENKQLKAALEDLSRRHTSNSDNGGYDRNGDRGFTPVSHGNRHTNGGGFDSPSPGRGRYRDGGRNFTPVSHGNRHTNGGGFDSPSPGRGRYRDGGRNFTPVSHGNRHTNGGGFDSPSPGRRRRRSGGRNSSGGPRIS